MPFWDQNRDFVPSNILSFSLAKDGYNENVSTLLPRHSATYMNSFFKVAKNLRIEGTLGNGNTFFAV